MLTPAFQRLAAAFGSRADVITEKHVRACWVPKRSLRSRAGRRRLNRAAREVSATRGRNGCWCRDSAAGWCLRSGASSVRMRRLRRRSVAHAVATRWRRRGIRDADFASRAATAEVTSLPASRRRRASRTAMPVIETAMSSPPASPVAPIDIAVAVSLLTRRMAKSCRYDPSIIALASLGRVRSRGR